MLEISVALLIIAIVLWAAGAILNIAPLLIGAKAVAAIGVILLVIAIILLLIPASGVDLTPSR